MKRTILALLAVFVIAIFISGCGQAEVSAPEDEQPSPAPRPAPEPEPEEEVQVAEPEPAPEPEPEPEPVKQMSKTVRDLLEDHSRVKSLGYLYQDARNYPMEWPTWVRGNEVAMDLREPVQASGDNYITKVYLNTASKTAEGYCESKIHRCEDPNEAVSVTYAKYKRKTPIDWIKSVKYAEKESEETMQQRRVLKLQFESFDGDSGVMWVDDYYGVPMEVWVESGSDTTKYIFEDISFNSVTDSDLEHQYMQPVSR